jgi:hypothetical protein
VEALAKRNSQDVRKLTHFNTHRHVILEDIDKLEDVLELLYTGAVNTRYAVFLSSRAGLWQMATFRTVTTLKGKMALLFATLTGLIGGCPSLWWTNRTAMSVWPPWTGCTTSTLCMA